MSDVFFLRETLCPWCGRKLNAATSTEAEADRRGPEAGDVSICNKCGGWLEYTGPTTLKRLSDEKWQLLKPHQQTQLERAREFIWRLRREP